MPPNHVRRRLLPLLLGAAIVPGLAACGGSDGSDDERDAFVNASTPAETTTSTPAGETDATSTPTGETDATTPPADGDACREVKAPEPRSGEPETPKPSPSRLSGKWTVTVQTSCGSFTVRLDTKSQPKTTASFASLVKGKFYDGLTFHRLAAGFVIQGGDPEGTGSGGPGYKVTEDPPSGASYTRGVVAMAKGGNEAAGTSGSQFFVVTGDDTGLPPEYAIVGEVTKGMETVDRIAAIGTGDGSNDGPPARTIVIDKATLKQG